MAKLEASFRVLDDSLTVMSLTRFDLLSTNRGFQSIAAIFSIYKNATVHAAFYAKALNIYKGTRDDLGTRHCVVHP